MPRLTELLPYASLLAVLVTIVFGTLTLRQWQGSRYLAAASELVHTIQSEQFSLAIARVMELPEDASAAVVRSDPHLAAAAYTVGHVFESLGVLVFHRNLQLHLVDHLVGGYVRSSWMRLKPYNLERRTELGVHFGEWFQWLAEQMEKHPAPGKLDGAYATFRKWKP